MSKVVKVVAVVAGIALAIPTGGSSLLATSLGISSLAATALVVGLSVGASLLQQRPPAPQNSPATVERLNASIDPRTPRKSWLGSTSGNTDIRDQEYSDDQVYLHRFVVTASHKIKGYREIWFDDKLAWTSTGGVQGEFVGYLSVNPITEGNITNIINTGPRMGNSRRYTGLAYVYFRFKLTGNDSATDSPFAQSIPSRMTIIGDGAYVYDPRLDSTVPGGSGPCRANDQTTWVWNGSSDRNPALALLFYLLGWKINGKLAVGRGIPPARIDLESFITAANLCDEPVARGVGGTEPRYRSDGVWSEGDDPKVVIDALKASMHADLDDAGGRLRLTVMHNDLGAPVASFGDDEILSGLKWEQTPSLVDTFNVVRGTYTDPSTNSLYQMVDYPEISLPSMDSIDRPDTFNLPLVQSPSQAQRLAKMRLQRQQYGGLLTTTLDITGWRVLKNDVIRLSSTPLGWANKLFRVADIDFNTDGTVPVVLREENAALYAWDASDVAPVQAAAPTTYQRDLNPIIRAIEDDIPSAIASKARYLTYFPTSADSLPGDLLVRLDLQNRLFRRLDGTEAVTIGGSPVTISGNTIDLPVWAEVSDKRTLEALEAALRAAEQAAQAQALALIAQGLADDAIAAADGKVQSFYQASPPTGASEGDLWFDTDDGNNQYRYTSGAWIDVQDTGIADAIYLAAGAQATADGKVTTFVGESAPTAEAIGDLWYKASTKEFRRWNGSSWVLILGNLSQHDLITTGLHDPGNSVDYNAVVPGGLISGVDYALVGSEYVGGSFPTRTYSTPAQQVYTANDLILLTVDIEYLSRTGSNSLYVRRVVGGVPTNIATLESVATSSGHKHFELRDSAPVTGSVYYQLYVTLDTGTIVDFQGVKINYTRVASR